MFEKDDKNKLYFMKRLDNIFANLNTVLSPTSSKQNIENTKTDNKNELTIQHNNLVEAKYRLSLQEKRLILWLLTQIKSNDEDFKLHKLEVSEFSKITGLGIDNQYSKLQKITLNLMKRVMKIYEPQTNSIFQVAWLSFARYYIKKGYIELRFDPALKPYLLQLKSQFTKISLGEIMQLTSIYAVRFYELLKQYEFIEKRRIAIKELRDYCGIAEGEYRRYSDFKKDVLERAKREINAKTEYNIDYTEIKESRKIVAIEWTINKKDLDRQKHLDRINSLSKELRSEAIIIDNLLEYGFGKTVAKRLIKLHGEETVKNAIKAVNIQIEKGRVKNPKAMIQTAITEKWHPEIYKTRSKL